MIFVDSTVQTRMIADKMFFRLKTLEQCETKEEVEKLKDRWVIEDSAENIASAIRSSTRMKGSKFLGIF